MSFYHEQLSSTSVTFYAYKWHCFPESFAFPIRENGREEYVCSKSHRIEFDTIRTFSLSNAQVFILPVVSWKASTGDIQQHYYELPKSCFKKSLARFKNIVWDNSPQRRSQKVFLFYAVAIDCDSGNHISIQVGVRSFDSQLP